MVLPGFTAQGIRWAWTTTHFANWMPLTWLSYMLDAQLWGIGPFGFHLTNLLLHVGATMMVTLISYRLTGRRDVAILTAILFGCHPIQVQAVTWIAERKGMLSSFFWLAAILAYLHYAVQPSRLRYAIVSSLLILSLLAKQMAVTFVFGLWLIDWLFLHRWPAWRPIGFAKNLMVWEKLPWFGLCVLSLAAGAYAQNDLAALKSVEAYPLLYRLNTAASGSVDYVTQLFISSPIPSSWARGYQFHYHAYLDIPYGRQLVIAGLISIATLYAAYRYRDRSPYPLFACLWLGISIVPASGLVQIGFQRMADRYAYIPMLGFDVLVATVLMSRWLRERLGTRTQLSLVAGIVALLSWRTHVETEYWLDSEKLYQRALTLDAQNPVALTNLGDYYLSQRQLDQAKSHFVQALNEFPDRHHIFHQLGKIASLQGDSKQAIECFEQSISSVTGGYPEAENSLAMEYIALGRLEEANRIFMQHTQRFPTNARAFGNLGACLYRQKDLPAAANAYQTALTLRSNVPQWNFHLGKIRYELSEFQEASRLFTRALDHLPTNAEIWRAKAFADFHLRDQDGMRHAVEQWFAIEGATPANRIQLAYLLQPFSSHGSPEWESLFSSSVQSDDDAANAWWLLLQRLQPKSITDESPQSSMDMATDASWQQQIADDFLLRTEWNAAQQQLDAVSP